MSRRKAIVAGGSRLNFAPAGKRKSATGHKLITSFMRLKMKIKETISRRNFLQLSASFSMLAGLGSFKFAQAAPVQDYKALVCLFMFGGNDGHNTVVPFAPAQSNAYHTA